MPKSPTRASQEAQKDEAQMLQVIEDDSKLFELLSVVFAKGRKKLPQSIEDLAQEHNCTASTMKKAWQKARQKDDARRQEELRKSLTRPTSTPRESRRSTRAQSADQTISAAASIADSTDNSCASSICGSPKSERARRASRRNLCPISEDNVNRADVNSSSSSSGNSSIVTADTASSSAATEPPASAAAAAATTADSTRHIKQQQQQQRKRTAAAVAAEEMDEKEDKEEEKEKEQQKPEVTPKDDNNVADSDGTGSTDHNLPRRSSRRRQKQAESTALLDSAETNVLRKFLETTLPVEDKSLRTLRFSESAMETPRNSKAHLNSASGSSRRVSLRLQHQQQQQQQLNKENKDSPDVAKEVVEQQQQTQLTGSEEATKLFFESIAITVGNFPKHDQASVKARVSKLVHELEYRLSMPATGGKDKVPAVSA